MITTSLEQAVLLAHHFISRPLGEFPKTGFLLRFWEPSSIAIRGFDSLEQAAEEAVSRFYSADQSPARASATSGPGGRGGDMRADGLVPLLTDRAGERTLKREVWRAALSEALDEVQALGEELDVDLLNAELFVAARIPGARTTMTMRVNVLSRAVFGGDLETALELQRRGARLVLDELAAACVQFCQGGEEQWLDVVVAALTGRLVGEDQDVILSSLVLRLAARSSDVDHATFADRVGQLVERVDDAAPGMLGTPDPTSGRSLVHIAAKHGWTRVLELCLERCPELATQADSTGRLPLDDALDGRHNQVRVVELLLSAATSKPGSLGEHPYVHNLCKVVAEQPKALEILRLLLDAGAPVECASANGGTAAEALFQGWAAWLQEQEMAAEFESATGFSSSGFATGFHSSSGFEPAAGFSSSGFVGAAATATGTATTRAAFVASSTSLTASSLYGFGSAASFSSSGFGAAGVSTATPSTGTTAAGAGSGAGLGSLSRGSGGAAGAPTFALSPLPSFEPAPDFSTSGLGAAGDPASASPDPIVLADLLTAYSRTRLRVSDPSHADRAAALSAYHADATTLKSDEVARDVLDVLRVLLEHGASLTSSPDALLLSELVQGVQIRSWNSSWYAELVSLLLDHGASPVTTDEQGNTALHHAVLRWHEWNSDMFEILKCLIVPELVLAKNAAGQSPLQIACIQVTSYEVIRLLTEAAPTLELDADTPINEHPFALCATRWPRPLYAQVGSAGLSHEHAAPDPAVTQGKQFWISLQSVPTELSFEELRLEDWLLEQGLAVPPPNDVHRPAAGDTVEQISCLQLFAEKGMQVPTAGLSGEPLLFEAVAQGNMAVVEQLLCLGSDATATNEFGETALFRLPCDLGVDQGAHDVANLARVLLDAGVDPTVESSRLGVGTALHHWLAAVARAMPSTVPPSCDAEEGDTKSGPAAVATLLLTGVDVDTRNSCGETLLHVASSGRDASIVELLLARGADVEATCEFGRNALHHWAAGHGDVAVLQVLLRSGIDPNASDQAGNTPLLFSVQRGSLTTAQALLADPQVNVNAVNHNGESAAYLFALCNCKASTALIRGHGADASVLTESGQSVFHAAVRNQQSASQLSDLAKAVSSLQIDTITLLQPDAAGNTPLHITSKFMPATQCATQPAALDALRSLKVLYEAVIEASEPVRAASVLSLANSTTGNSALVEAALRLIRYRAFLGNGRSVMNEFAWLLESSLEHFGDDFDWASPNADGVTPFHCAAALMTSSSVQLLQRLITLGSQLTAVDNAGNTVLHYAARSCSIGNVGAVLDLLRDAHDDTSVERLVNAGNSDGHTCLSVLCASLCLSPCGDVFAMRSFSSGVWNALRGPGLDKLLDAGAHPDTTVHGIPLLFASWHAAAFDKVGMLLDLGVNPMRRADPQCGRPGLCRSCESVRGKTVFDFPHAPPRAASLSAAALAIGATAGSGVALFERMGIMCAEMLFTLGLAKPRADTPLARLAGHPLFDLNCASLVFELIDGSPHAIDRRGRSERARQQRKM